MSYHTPHEIIKAGGRSGGYRMSLPGWNILLRGGMAGAYIGMGASLMIIVSTGVAATLGEGMSRLIMGIVFPLGVILIVMTGAELFTGDAMLAPFAAFTGAGTWTAIFRLWTLSYIGNLIGALGFAGLITAGVLIQVRSGWTRRQFLCSVHGCICIRAVQLSGILWYLFMFSESHRSRVAPQPCGPSGHLC